MSEQSDSDSESSPDSSVSVSDSISLDPAGIADEVEGIAGFWVFALRTTVGGTSPLGRDSRTADWVGLEAVDTPGEAPSELHVMSSSTVLAFLDFLRSVKKKKYKMNLHICIS